MTANELLVLLGRAWPRLLIYPGGLAAFGLIWLIDLLQKRAPSAGSQIVEAFDDPRPLILSSVALPWLALALLPLPLAVGLPRQIDIVLALALLEWPNVLAIRQELRLGGLRRLAAALNSYPALLLATLALAQAGNSLELAALARPPGDSAAISARALHWLGALALALALPPALRIGAFAGEGQAEQAGQASGEAGYVPEQAGYVPEQAGYVPEQAGYTPEQAGYTPEQAGHVPEQAGQAPEQAGYVPEQAGYVPGQARYMLGEARHVPEQATQTLNRDKDFSRAPASTCQPSAICIGLRLRALGLVALAALPWAGAEGTSVALLRMLGAAALIAALLAGYDRLTRRQAARRWAWAYLALDLALLLALLVAAYLALQARLA